MNKIKQIKTEDGFTLLEVLISVIILAIGLMGVAMMQLTAIQGNAWGFRLSEATERIETKIEEFRNTPYDDIKSKTESKDADGYIRKSTVTNDSPVADTKTVLVEVKWVDPHTGKSHEISMQTVIAQK